jgi:DNA-binding winged helix-turn-helix (wHTH) protein
MDSSVERFGDFELDLERDELRQNGEVVRLPRQPMTLLILLVRRRLVTRDEIARALWAAAPATVDAAIDNVVCRLRRTLGDDSERPRFAQAVVGVGYRFVAPRAPRERNEPAMAASSRVNAGNVALAAAASALAFAVAMALYGAAILLFILTALVLAFVVQRFEDAWRSGWLSHCSALQRCRSFRAPGVCRTSCPR